MGKGITSREEDFSRWYNELVAKAGLAENSGVRGCMVIKPYGYSIWEKMQNILDGMFKETGHSNVYFPIFIPKSHFSKEAKHVDGFAKECAIVTHYRLKQDGNDLVVDEDAKLEEELIVRPTSETIIWDTYRKWIQSYRDLPLLLNQWANVVRWEMRTRLFLRTSEFLWQEGHTAHANKQEAIDESIKIMHLYADFVENHMAVPVIKGIKTEKERFAGAEETYCIEAMMQDGKALQAGTSHFLGQNFSKAFDVKYSSKEGKQEHVWATSWGVSTRLIGALIMTHSDDKGLVLPPKLAPIQVVIVPIYKNEDQLNEISEVAEKIMKQLKDLSISYKFDNRDEFKPGWKFNEYELKGVPIRLTIGPKDLEKGSLEMYRRDTSDKNIIPFEDASKVIEKELVDIQDNMFKKAVSFRESRTFKVKSMDEFEDVINNKAGFAEAFWDGTTETENIIRTKTKATIRCIPLSEVNNEEEGNCILTGKATKIKVIFAKAY